VQREQGRARGKALLIAGIALIVVGAGLMDQAGRTQSALWWDLSGVFAFLGFLLSVVSLALTEGWDRLARGLRR
jgi:hypothetical protein